MPDDSNESLFKKQKAIKPTPEDIAGEIENGDDLRNLMDFLGFLRENKLSPRWQSSNTWSVRYRNKAVCHLRVNYNEKGWRVSNRHFVWEKWFEGDDKYITDDDLKGFILDNIRGPVCVNTGCKGVENVTIMGKGFDSVCGCWPHSVLNPGGAEFDCLKKLILAIKAYIADFAAASKV